MGALIRIGGQEDDVALLEGLRREGFVRDKVTVDPHLVLDYLEPFITPTKVERFRFSRAWMREVFQRINDPRNPAFNVALKLNLPPSYLLIHRTWLGGIGVLCQLGGTVRGREIVDALLPGADLPPVGQRCTG